MLWENVVCVVKVPRIANTHWIDSYSSKATEHNEKPIEATKQVQVSFTHDAFMHKVRKTPIGGMY